MADQRSQLFGWAAGLVIFVAGFASALSAKEHGAAAPAQAAPAQAAAAQAAPADPTLADAASRDEKTPGASAAEPGEKAAAHSAKIEREAQEAERKKWEDRVVFYGDEATDKWTLRIEDKNVHDRAFFEFLELWKFDTQSGRWAQLPVEKDSKAIVMPKDKASDEPPDTQVLVDLEAIPPRTAGLWYAHWRVTDIRPVEGGTLMVVGTSMVKGKRPDRSDPPPGMLRMAVPLSLEKADYFLVPNPRIYCVPGGKGGPDEKAGPTDKAKS